MVSNNRILSKTDRFSVPVHWLLVASMLLSSNIFAAGVPPAENWSKVGEGRFKFAFWSIYDAYLYTPSGQFEPVEQTTTLQAGKAHSSKFVTAAEQLPVPFYLQLRYLRDIDKSDLIENTFDQWQKQDVDVVKVKRYKTVLNDTWPDTVAEGDSLAIRVTATSSQFYFNETPIGLALDQEFGFFFAGIWLATSTMEPKLRAQLIGRNKNN